jgi:hypothetical protein
MITGEQEQRGDQVQHLADQRRVAVAEPGLVVHLDVRICSKGLLEIRLHGGHVGALVGLDQHERVEHVGDVHVVRVEGDGVVADQAVLRVERDHPEACRAGGRELHGDRVPHGPVVLCSRVVEDGDRVRVRQVLEPALDGVDLRDDRERPRFQPGHERGSTLDLRLGLADLRDRVDAGHRARILGGGGAEAGQRGRDQDEVGL